MIDYLDNMVDEIPPIDQPQRFGNQAFRTWYQKLKDVRHFKKQFLVVLLYGIF